MNHCIACGYSLEQVGTDLCFPCLVRGAIVSMSGNPAPIRKIKTKALRETPRQQDLVATAALAALSHAGKALAKGKNTTQSSKAKAGQFKKSGASLKEKSMVCVLCGQGVAAGSILKHKAEAHGEAQVVPSPARNKRTNTWVSVYQGGLPGLGKRR